MTAAPPPPSRSGADAVLVPAPSPTSSASPPLPASLVTSGSQSSTSTPDVESSLPHLPLPTISSPLPPLLPPSLPANTAAAIDLTGLSDSDDSPAPASRMPVPALLPGGTDPGWSGNGLADQAVLGQMGFDASGSSAAMSSGNVGEGVGGTNGGVPETASGPGAAAAVVAAASLPSSLDVEQPPASSSTVNSNGSTATEGIVVEVDSGSDSDDFTITASTGPTRPGLPPVRRRMMPPGAARTQGFSATGSIGPVGSSSRGLDYNTHPHHAQHAHGRVHHPQHGNALVHNHQRNLHSSPLLHSSLPVNPENTNAAQLYGAAFAKQLGNNSFSPTAGFAKFAGNGAQGPRRSNFASSSSSVMGGFTTPGPSFAALGAAGPSSVSGMSSNGDGSPSAPIDVEQHALMTPPRPPVILSPQLPKKPICIGGFQTRAIMLYPKDAVTTGKACPPDSPEPWEIIPWRGVELLRVKLKLRKAGSMPRPDEPWSPPTRDTIQVLTPQMSQYIGDLEESTADILVPMLHRGLCRMEGFAMRLHPGASQYECRVHVVMFTLPSNVSYIADTLIAHNIFLLDPVPDYDPRRHMDEPEYHNAHGGGDRAAVLHQAFARKQYSSSQAGSFYNAAMEKAKLVEVQRQQVEKVFESIADGVELEQSDPGPWIATELFPHQRQALTFLLQGEQDWSSLKTARKTADKKLMAKIKKEPKGSGEATPAASSSTTPAPETEPSTVEATSRAPSRARSLKDDSSRSLWEPFESDENGRTKWYKNKITGEKQKMRKSSEKPKEAKGAILADDMGLGKTLSVVSLIAATHRASKEWAEKKLETIQGDDDDVSGPSSSGLPVSAMSTRVFGMPDNDSSGDAEGSNSKKGKKRRWQETDATADEHRARRALIVKRSRATLLVCPMSTITNWEDQIKEHWDGRVEVVGGVGTTPAAKGDKKNGDGNLDPDWDILRVYIYHGTTRKMDARFLAEFDIVITSYSTLANEYSKQCAAMGEDDTPAETGANTDEDGNNADSSRSSRNGTKTDPEAEFKPAELSDALRMSKKAKPRKRVVSGGANGAVDATSPLQAVDWFRVVLDEAHCIKSSVTVACKASCSLEADRRIALSGTPIQNKIEDVWALFKFLRISPIDEKDTFTKYITSPCKTGDPVGIARLQLIMRSCTLRRTKDTVQENGKKILDLPKRNEHRLWLDLREDERAVYVERLTDIKSEIDELARKKQLTKNYAHVLQQLLILRQTCDHVDLPSAGVVEEDYDGTIMDFDVAVAGIQSSGLSMPRAQSVICSLKDTDRGAVCGDCGADFGPYFPSIGPMGIDELEDRKAEPETKKGKKTPMRPILTKCQHVFCLACFKRSVYAPWPKRVTGVTRQCGGDGCCQVMLRLDKLDAIEVVPPNANGENDDDVPKKVVRRKKWTRKPGEALNLSTKMAYLHAELLRFSKHNRNSANYDPWSIEEREGETIELDEDGLPIPVKSIVFSQWTTMLDRIEDMLQEINIGYCRLDGTMTREQRAEAMDALRNKKTVEVMLVSTRAGGVGLNLTAASRCYLVDPYWNPSVEAQAIDRIHRMGQKREVTAIKLMLNDTVENKLERIQHKKSELAKMSLKNMSRKELMETKAEELASLFN